MSTKHLVGIVVMAFVGLIGLAAMLGSFFTVKQYEEGVVTTWGKYSYAAGPGLHFKVPFIQSVRYYRTDIRDLQPKKAELWNGVLPQNIYAGAPIPFLQMHQK